MEIGKILQHGPARYPQRENGDGQFAEVDQRRLALVVGLCAISLPLVMFVGAVNPIWNTCFRDSISHFYYAQFLGSFFVGILFFIGAYLIVYRGRDKDGAEGILSTGAGICAIGVAVFPTSGPGCDTPPFEARAMVDFVPGAEGTLELVREPLIADHFSMFPGASYLHYGSAALLFAFLLWFAFFVFTAVDEDKLNPDGTVAVESKHRNPDGTLKPAKKLRNAIYYFSGTVMLVCMLALAYSAFIPDAPPGEVTRWDAGNWTFWFEAIALVCFGISWMVKGRIIKRLNDD